MRDVLLSVKPSTELITENVGSFFLNPSPASLHPLPQLNSDAIQEGIHQWILSSDRASGSPTVLLDNCQGSLGYAVPCPWPQLALGLESWPHLQISYLG